ncbi:hypothetical protein [Pseudotamlana agarivorans]|uniref:hypothetical protein n=1 Tax=Pseudotamlana agarivorans TaxID=481183 RepID=UPI000834627C|nr:hypothetical protein [Tamlana agarivorans]
MKQTLISISIILFSGFCTGINAQGNSLEKRIKEYKSKNLKDHYEVFHNCFPDGRPDLRSITDSIKSISYVKPGGHDILFYNSDSNQIIELIPNKYFSLSDLIVKIEILDNININLLDIYDYDLGMKLTNEKVTQIGKDYINKQEAFFIESISKNSSKSKFCELKFYVRHPTTKKIIITTLKDSKRKDYRSIFCTYRTIITNLNWI